MIKLRGWHNEHVEVQLDESDVIDEVIRMLKKKDKLENVDKLSDKGRMVEYCEYATSHSWTTEEDRGKPTPAQRKTLMVIAELKLLKKEPRS